eukprot:5705803-Prymnesium_polylepis.1
MERHGRESPHLGLARAVAEVVRVLARLGALVAAPPRAGRLPRVPDGCIDGRRQVHERRTRVDNRRAIVGARHARHRHAADPQLGERQHVRVASCEGHPLG